MVKAIQKSEFRVNEMKNENTLTNSEGMSRGGGQTKEGKSYKHY